MHGLLQGGNISTMLGQVLKCFVTKDAKNGLFFDIRENFSPSSTKITLACYILSEAEFYEDSENLSFKTSKSTEKN